MTHNKFKRVERQELHELEEIEEQLAVINETLNRLEKLLLSLQPPSKKAVSAVLNFVSL
jgi:hypothetical protein